MGWWGTLLGKLGDLDDNKISSVQNFRSLGAVEASNLQTGIGTEGGTICVLSRVASQLKTFSDYLSKLVNYYLVMEHSPEVSD